MSREDDIVRMLNTLKLHAPLVARSHVFGKGELPYDQENMKAVDKLVKLNLAWLPVDEDEPRLSSELTRLIQRSLLEKGYNVIETDMDGMFRRLKDATDNYKREIRRASRDVSTYRDILEQEVSDFCYTLAKAADDIWHMIEDDFGYVTSLENKARENEKAIERVEAMINALIRIDPEELSRESGSDRLLTKLLKLKIPKAKHKSLSELQDAIHRLKASLFKTRQLQARGRRIKKFSERLASGEKIDLSPLFENDTIPPVLNVASRLPVTGHADVSNEKQIPDLSQLLVGMRRVEMISPDITAESVAPGEPPPPPMPAQDSALKAGARDFFVHCFKMGKGDVLSFFHERGIPGEPELWILAVLMRHNSLTVEESSYFDLHYDEARQLPFDGNLVVKNIEVTCA